MTMQSHIDWLFGQLETERIAHQETKEKLRKAEIDRDRHKCNLDKLIAKVKALRDKYGQEDPDDQRRAIAAVLPEPRD